MRRYVLVGLVVAALTPSLAAQPRPEDRSAHVVWQTAGGALGGLVGGFALAMLGASTIGPHSGEDPGLIGAIYGFGAGLVLGTSLGVHLSARSQDYNVSYGTALGGSVLGFLMLWPLGSLINFDADNTSFWVIIIGAPTLGAVLMTNLQINRRRQNQRVSAIVAPGPAGTRVGLRVRF